MDGPLEQTKFGYSPGFGNTLATEAAPGALPMGRNSPQKTPFGLYAEQRSGTAFTALRAENRRSRFTVFGRPLIIVLTSPTPAARPCDRRRSPKRL